MALSGFEKTDSHGYQFSCDGQITVTVDVPTTLAFMLGVPGSEFESTITVKNGDVTLGTIKDGDPKIQNGQMACVRYEGTEKATLTVTFDEETCLLGLTICRGPHDSHILGKNGYSTFSSDHNFLICGAKAYWATYDKENSTVTLEPIAEGAVIPSNQGVILKGKEGDTVLLTSTDATATVDLSANCLKPVTAATKLFATDLGQSYVLASNGPLTAFVKMNDTKLVGQMLHKAYFHVAESEPQQAKMLSISFDKDNVTSVLGVHVSYTRPLHSKFLNNGRLLIRTPYGTFDAQGIKKYELRIMMKRKDYIGFTELILINCLSTK